MASAEQRHSGVPEDKRRRPTVGTDARALLDWQQYALGVESRRSGEFFIFGLPFGTEKETVF